MNIERPLSRQPIPANARKVFTGHVLFDVYQWEQTLFDGKTAIFEKAKRKADSVNVIPVTNEGKIILNQQTQPGMEPFIGCFGGRIDEGEMPIDTAKRELLEESGLVAQDYQLLLATQPDEKVDWVCYSFIAKNLQQTKETALEAGEKIQQIEFSFSEFMEAITQPNFRDLEVALFLLQAQQHPEQFAKIQELFAV